MLCSKPSNPFRCLDYTLYAISLSLTIIIVYLLLTSIQLKFSDCQGVYGRCGKNEELIHLKNLRNSKELSEDLANDLTAFIAFLLDLSSSNEDKLLISTLDSGDTNNNNSTNNKTNNNNSDIQHHIWNYDWIGLNQYVLLASFLFTLAPGLISIAFKHRRALFISILIYLIQLIQLALLETSDDRDFPSSVYRDGYTIARYSLVYSNNTSLFLGLKFLFIILILFDFILFITYFALLRYEYLFAQQAQ